MSEWDYTSYWRKNYEAREAVAWGSSMLAATAVQLMTEMPVTPYLITLGVQAGFALAAIPGHYAFIGRKHVSLEQISPLSPWRR